MVIISVMGVINISRQYFSTLVGMGFRSHDFEDELKISFLISSSGARSQTFILDLISVFCTDGILCTLSGNLERIVSILSTKYLEKWSQSDFTDVNAGRGLLLHTKHASIRPASILNNFLFITTKIYVRHILSLYIMVFTT